MYTMKHSEIMISHDHSHCHCWCCQSSSSCPFFIINTGRFNLRSAIIAFSLGMLSPACTNEYFIHFWLCLVLNDMNSEVCYFCLLPQ